MVADIPEIKEMSINEERITRKCGNVVNKKTRLTSGKFGKTYVDGNKILKVIDVLNTKGIDVGRDGSGCDLVSNAIKLNFAELKNIKNFLSFFINKKLGKYIYKTYVYNGSNLVNILESSLENIDDYICSDLLTYNIFYYMDNLSSDGCM